MSELQCSLEIGIQELFMTKLKEDLVCFFELKGIEKSVFYPSGTVLFENLVIEEEDSLRLKVKKGEELVGQLEVRLMKFLATGRIDKTFNLEKEGRRKAGEVRLIVEVLKRPCSRCEFLDSVVAELTSKIEYIKSQSENFSTAKDLQEETESFMNEEVNVLRGMIEEYYKSRDELEQVVVKTTARFEEDYKIENERLESAILERDSSLENEEELKNEIRDLFQQKEGQKSRILELESQIYNLTLKLAKAVQQNTIDKELKKQLEDSWTNLHMSNEKYEQSLKEYLNNSNDQQLYINTLISEKTKMEEKILELEKEVFSSSEKINELESSNLVLTQEIAKLQSNSNIFSSHQTKEKQSYTVMKVLEGSYAKLQEEIEFISHKNTENTQKFTTEISYLLSQNEKLSEALKETSSQLKSERSKTETLLTELQKSHKNFNLLKKENHFSEDLHSIINKQISEIEMHEKHKFKLIQDIHSLNASNQSQHSLLKTNQEAIKELKSSLKECEEENDKFRNYILEIKRKKLYIPIKNDPVDIALADYINTVKPAIKLQFEREDAGVYQFGAKRIFVKLENGKIIIRVGGGFMEIEDFLEVYTPKELEKYENKQRELAEEIRRNLYGKFADSLISQSKSRENVRTESPNEFGVYYGIHRKSVSPSTRSKLNHVEV